MSSLFPPLPVFLDLAGRAAILICADAVSARLAGQLLDAGASVTFISPDAGAEARALCPPARLAPRRWRSSDMRAAALVVSNADEPHPRRARRAAKAANAIFLTLGAQEISDVSLGEAAARGPLALALAGPGLPAGLTHALLERLEDAAPARLADFFEAAMLCGARSEDRGFWTDTLAAALLATPEDWRAWLAARL